MLDLNRIHSNAICQEIAERLAAAQGPQPNELPPRLVALMDELAKVEPRESPSEVRRDMNA